WIGTGSLSTVTRKVSRVSPRTGSPLAFVIQIVNCRYPGVVARSADGVETEEQELSASAWSVGALCRLLAQPATSGSTAAAHQSAARTIRPLSDMARSFIECDCNVNSLLSRLRGSGRAQTTRARFVLTVQDIDSRNR